MQPWLKEVARNSFVRCKFETRQKCSVCKRELFLNQYQSVIKHILECAYCNYNLLGLSYLIFGTCLVSVAWFNTSSNVRTGKSSLIAYQANKTFLRPEGCPWLWIFVICHWCVKQQLILFFSNTYIYLQLAWLDKAKVFNRSHFPYQRWIIFKS